MRMPLQFQSKHNTVQAVYTFLNQTVFLSRTFLYVRYQQPLRRTLNKNNFICKEQVASAKRKVFLDEIHIVDIFFSKDIKILINNSRFGFYCIWILEKSMVFAMCAECVVKMSEYER